MTKQEIRRLLRQAQSGNRKAETQLRRRLTQTAKEANQRLRRLEKYNLTGSAAYQIAKEQAKEFRNTGYFTKNAKRGKITDIAAELQAVENFLKFQTSTVKGERRHVNSVIRAIRDNGIAVQNAQQMYDLMATDFFAEFVDYDSWDALRAFAEMADKNITRRDLERIYEEYLNKQYDFVTITLDWKEIIDAYHPSTNN